MTLQVLVNAINGFLVEKDNYKPDLISIEKFFKKFSITENNIEKNIQIVCSENENLKENNGESEDRLQEKTFGMAWKVILSSILRGSLESRRQALATACNLLKIQSDLLSTQSIENEKFYFPKHMLEDILRQLLSDNVDNRQILQKFKEYTENNDVLYYCWEIIPRIATSSSVSHKYMHNYLELLNVLPLKTKSKIKDKTIGFPEDEKPKILCEIEGGRRFHLNIKKVHNSMQECWKFVAAMQLNTELLQKALLVLHDNLLPHLPQSVLLTDFLMNAMDHFSTRVLALQGMFVLMQKHNLEYPLVYNKLYSMFTPKMISSLYKSRLFYLTDLFLSSTHLPETLVAGFVKKFSRLALVVAPTDAIVLLHIINNLIIRHPGLKKMIDSGEKISQELNNDPYNVSEPDPSKSNAIQSSLWEVADLRNHIYPGVASAAILVLSTQQNKLEKPVADFLDDTMDTLMQTELNRKYKQVFLNPEKPDYENSKNGISEFWSFC